VDALTARATINPRSASPTVDCTSIAYFAWLAKRPFTNPKAPSAPLAMSRYRLASSEEADRLDASAAADSERAKAANERANNYMLAVVLFASSVFFAGISAKLRARNARITLLGLGSLLFLGAIVWARDPAGGTDDVAFTTWIHRRLQVERARCNDQRRVGEVAVSTVDLARVQFATTSLYHFLFVPLTLGMAPLVAVMQTLWYRGGDDAWLRLARFFGTLMLINFAIGVATGLVQEFQFGMNWSEYSKFVGDVFGAPLAIEGLAAFMLESTFLGLWIFGWDRLSKRVHLGTIWLFALGSWLSAFFIIVANSWMQRPVGSDVVDGKAQLTNVWELMTNRFAIWAYIHVILVGITTAAVVIFGVACWHFLRGRNQELFRHAAKLALIVGVPISAVNLGVGSHVGVVITDYQPMKIAATEAQWDTCQPCAFSLFQIGGFTVDDQTPTFSIQIPHVLSLLATDSWNGEVRGMNPLQTEDVATSGPGTYRPLVRTTYWSMRIMAYAGSLVFFVLAVCAFFYRRRTLVAKRWLLWAGVLTIPLPYVAALAGWVLSEVGRQPWIVWGLLKTADANSPSVSTTTIVFSLGTFALLYGILAVVDFVLMRRYARLDPPEVGGEGDEFSVPAVSY